MKIQFNWLILSLLLTSAFSKAIWAEDIDIFAGTREADPSLPNIIFILDNTSNWARQSQQWPGGLQQGQSEVRAIKNTFAELDGQVNVGIMEYITDGASADNNAAYTRFHLQELSETSHGEFDDILDKIFDDINEPIEKRDSGNPYGDLPWDFYNYLGGLEHSNNGAGTPVTDTWNGSTVNMADPDAYTSQWGVFNSPLGSLDICADTYLIFIGNNVEGSIATDDTTNSDALRAAYAAAGKTAPDALAGDNSGDPLVLFEFETEERTIAAIPGECEPDTVVPAYTRPAYCEEDVVIPEQTIPQQILGESLSCWKGRDAFTEEAACTAEENTSGLCVGETDCVCFEDKGAGCVIGGRPSDRTWKRMVGIPEYIQPEQTIEGQCFEEEEIPEQIIPGECTEDIPAATYEVFVPGSGTDTTTSGDYNFDDWAKFLYNVGVPFETTVDDVTYAEDVRVKTYVIDVFNRQQNEDLSKVWFNAANSGGGRYFQANSEDEIVAALNSIVGDIIAKESSFAAVSLPLSTTNRARVDNQLYIGMFRPALGKEPRWWGNLKRYQLALFNSIPRVADVNLQEAINSASGFPKDCAESFWTSDSGAYWENLGIDPPVEGECTDPDVTESPWSDLPDGKFVEKGSAAQKMREGPAGDSRNILTVSDANDLRSLADTDAAAMGGDAVYDYFIGDVAGTGEVLPASGLRASIHGDVVHASPLAFRHAADSVTVYVGTNGGDFRAVNGTDGTERWALVAPEHFGKIERLYDNYPLVEYTGADEELGFEHDPKDYFFDGSTGLLSGYQDDGTLIYAYIFPTQRRGGRMVYALDVTDPDADPDLLWRVGCPNLDDNTGCSTGFTSIGQTWSKPVGGLVEGYVDGDGNPQLVVAFGGGFDDCLNADVATYPSACNSGNGRGVYILDALTGDLLAQLDTDAPVITDLAPIDINFDGTLDFLYMADVEGSLYRVNFITLADSNPQTGITVLAEDEWTIEKIAFESDVERRFYNAPVAGAFQGTVIVTIGSGDRERPLEANYPYADEVGNRFYAFFDEPYKVIVADPDEELETGETHIIDLDGDTMFPVTADPDADPPALTNYDGWYMDLSDRGEQVANASAIAGGKVFFNSFQPGGSTVGLCSEPLGIGTGYAVDLFDPEFTEGNEITAPGLPIPPVIATVKVPPGEPPCDGADCDEVPEDPCGQPDNDCEIVTVCIGCEGFEPVEVVPNAPPIRQRVFFTEDIDRDGSN